MLLTDLPEVVLEHIFSFLTYDEIAKSRIVCKQFNELGWYLLNRGFIAAEKYQSASLKAVKLLLPRRESERRKHPLSKKCDILIAIETRLSMLSMAFSRFIETKMCCFIPGKVIDELFRVMRSLDDTLNNTYKEPIPPHQILQELRDVSTMAIEYFDDKIAPDLKKKEMTALSLRNSVFDISHDLASSSHYDLNNYDFHSKSKSNISRQSIEKIVKECYMRYRKDDIYSKMKMKKESMVRKKQDKYVRIIRRQGKMIKELTETVNDLAVRLSNNEAVINDLKKQNDEWKHNLSHKFSKIIDVPSEENTIGVNSASGSKQKLSNAIETEASIKKKRKLKNFS